MSFVSGRSFRLVSALSIMLLGVVMSVGAGGAASAGPASITLTGPTGSQRFGDRVLVLANGNFVVTDPYFDSTSAVDVGAVYLYDGATNALISTLTGTTANDRIGDDPVRELTNGNFVVASPDWDDGSTIGVGAVTLVNGATGLSGTVSKANSLYGTTAGDQVGVGGATALTNGNYVVRSYAWSNGSTGQVGAMTWVNGATGLVGAVSTANSLYGTTAYDAVGLGGATALTNGNYVVASPEWNDGSASPVGAVTWANGATGLVGAVNTTNSLYGATAGDQVGRYGVEALTNGNYVVASPFWSNGSTGGVGAVTWANGATGLAGAVSTTNSLYGTTASDQVGYGSVTALTNGNYVVTSPFWRNGFTSSAGAVTWGNGATGLVGAVSTANSLYGTTAGDRVGGVSALTNGDYVVASFDWDNGLTADVGAVTWANGATGLVGAVSTANSLYGTTPGDGVGEFGAEALTNGNYVVGSPLWDNGSTADVGAVTWANGATGLVGAVSTANSLYGTTATDRVGGVGALTNGNYVVSSPLWNKGSSADVGAVTWANGATGLAGAVSTANSLYGTTVNDQVGNRGVVALPNGRSVVVNSVWDNGGTVDAGAISLSDATGLVGAVSSANSVAGSDAQGLTYTYGGVTAAGAVVIRGDNRVVLVSVVRDVVSLRPGRLADTRASGSTVDGQFAAGGKRAAGSVLELTVAGRGGVPASALSVGLNVTAVGPDGGGFLTVFPCGVVQPNASNVNFKPGQDIANAIVTAIGAGGKVCVATSAATDLIVDANGAFPIDTTITTSTPARVHDSRAASATVDGLEQGGGRVAANSITTVLVAGRAGLPKDARAAIVNVTADATDAAGFVTVFPCGTAKPNASNLNYPNGGTVAGLSVAKLGADGSVCVFTSAAMQLIVDVTGYVPSTTTYLGREPSRFLDTRSAGATVDGQSLGAGVRPADSTVEFVIPGRAGLSASTKTAVLNVTSTGSQAAGFLTVYPCGTPRPTASNVNYQAGTDIANTVITAIGAGGKVCVYTSSPTHIIADLNGTLNA
jgi:trimeric autotransporter adhesin